MEPCLLYEYHFYGPRDSRGDDTFFLAATPEIANIKGIWSACGDSLEGGQSTQGWFTLVKIHSLEDVSVP
jgi:hypothetical protein